MVVANAPQKFRECSPPKIWGAKNIILSNTFLTTSTLYTAYLQNETSHQQINLQYVAYKVTYFSLPVTQKWLRTVGLLRPTHKNSAFFQLLSKTSATKFLCVKTSSGKVVATSFPYLTVHRWIADDAPIYLKFAIQVTHPMKI